MLYTNDTAVYLPSGHLVASMKEGDTRKRLGITLSADCTGGADLKQWRAKARKAFYFHSRILLDKKSAARYEASLRVEYGDSSNAFWGRGEGLAF